MTAATTDINHPGIDDREVCMGPLQRIAGGDRSAVSDCIDSYGNLIWFLARKYCATTSDAEDAVQEIFIELWQSASRYQPHVASEETFVSMIARRRLIDRRRKASSGLQQVQYEDHHFETLASELDCDSSDRNLELADEAAKAAECLDKLSQVQKNVLKLNIHQGHSHATIADVLKLPLGTVKSFARRGLISLRDCMNRPTSTLAESRPS